MADYRVHYIRYDGYWVTQQYATRELAQEFIDINAKVYPLPGPAWIEERNAVERAADAAKDTLRRPTEAELDELFAELDKRFTR
jgi:hypothetical protein